MRRHLGHEFFGVSGELLGCEVLYVRGDGPLMAERVFHLTVAVAPERVGHRHIDFATGGDGAVEQRVGVLGVDVEIDAGAAATFRREAGRRKFPAEH